MLLNQISSIRPTPRANSTLVSISLIACCNKKKWFAIFGIRVSIMCLSYWYLNLDCFFLLFFNKRRWSLSFTNSLQLFYDLPAFVLFVFTRTIIWVSSSPNYTFALILRTSVVEWLRSVLQISSTIYRFHISVHQKINTFYCSQFVDLRVDLYLINFNSPFNLIAHLLFGDPRGIPIQIIQW